jgi:hypothetical protein
MCRFLTAQKGQQKTGRNCLGPVIEFISIGTLRAR